MIEKVVNIKAKVNLQLLSKTKKINSICLKNYMLLAKKNEDKINWEH